MPTPLAICLEDLDATSPDERFLRCVALAGRQAGLRIDASGQTVWQDQAGALGCCELWVSADERLILYRPPQAAPVEVRRAGRSLPAPQEKPVVLVSGDELVVKDRRLRVHVHGPAPRVAAPSFLSARSRAHAGAVAAALAIGAAVAGCDKIDVRDAPPEPPPPPPDAAGPPPATTTAATSSATIDVRETPPEVIADRPPTVAPTGSATSPQKKK